MAVAYREYLDRIRTAFPPPKADPFANAYFVFSILRGLDQVDRKRSQLPFLGTATSPDFSTAQTAELAAEPADLETVVTRLVDHLEGMILWGHPRAQMNVVPPPSIPSVLGFLLAAIFNPNLVSEESSQNVAVAEAKVANMIARLIGYDPAQSTGLFTFGGTGANLYGVKIGLEKAIPGAMDDGIREPVAVVCSDQSHYARLNIAGWLGIGQKHLTVIPTSLGNSMRIDHLETALRSLFSNKIKIAAILATMGSTDAFGIDDLAAIVKLRDQLAQEYALDYRPAVHADAVIGWAWSVFNDYDFERNELGFRPRTVRSLAKACSRIRWLWLADSVSIDFHKTGFAPYTASLFLVRQREELRTISRQRDRMPYLFQTGSYHPGAMTLETSRPGTGPMAALANLLLFGKNGMRALLGHLVEMAETLREELESHSPTSVLNGDNVGTVTLFRVYPDGIDTFSIKDQEREDPNFRQILLRHNAFNRRIFEELHADAMAGDGVFVSMTDCYRLTSYNEPINAIKSYILSPFADEANIRHLVRKVLEVRQRVQAEFASDSTSGHNPRA